MEDRRKYQHKASGFGLVWVWEPLTEEPVLGSYTGAVSILIYGINTRTRKRFLSQFPDPLPRSELA
jgi:hypothetical protein